MVGNVTQVDVRIVRRPARVPAEGAFAFPEECAVLREDAEVPAYEEGETAAIVRPPQGDVSVLRNVDVLYSAIRGHRRYLDRGLAEPPDRQTGLRAVLVLTDRDSAAVW